MSQAKEYSTNMKKYFEILNKNRVVKSTTGEQKKPTHASLGDPIGGYDFSGEKGPKLIDIYQKVVYEGGNNLYLTELHLPQGPILIDIDLIALPFFSISLR